MDNKIKHYNPTQSVTDMEFKPLLRGESPYYGNLNRPAQSAYDLVKTIADIQSWSGPISILNPVSQVESFKLYQIVKITNEELVTTAKNTDNFTTDRFGIVVAEPEFDPISNKDINVVVCTFCPNFIYPGEYATNIVANVGDNLYISLGSSIPMLSTTPNGRIIAKKTGTNSIFFCGTAELWVLPGA